MLSIVAEHGRIVHLEAHPHAVQAGVLLLAHVLVTLRMRQHRPESGAHGAVYHVPEIVGPGPCGGLHQYGAFLPVEQEILFRQVLLEELVHHVFGCEMEFDWTVVHGLELLEALFQPGSGVRDVLHGVRGEPEGTEAGLLEHGEDGKGVTGPGDAVVHVEEYVRMMVRSSFQEPFVSYRVFSAEQSHVEADP